MPYLPDSGFDGSVADRLKRRIFNAGLDPSAPSATDIPIRTYDIPPVNDQALRDIGNATVGVEPRPSFVQRLLWGLQSVARDPRTANVAAGLASVFRPTDTGAQGFLGSAADAFLNASQYTNQRAVQQREQALKDRLTQAQIDNYRSEAANRGVQNAPSTQLEYIQKPGDPTLELGFNRNPRTNELSPAYLPSGAQVQRQREASTGRNSAANINYDNAGELRREFNQQIAPHEIVARFARGIETAAQNPSAAGDLSLIFGYMKILDPNSSVREGEQASAANAQGVPSKIIATYNRILNGERFSPAARADFLRQSRLLVQSQRAQAQQYITRYQNLAKTYGFKPEEITFDPYQFPGDTSGTTPTPASDSTAAPTADPYKGLR